MKHKVFSLLAVVAALAACQSDGSIEIDGVSGATALPVVPMVPVVFEPLAPFPFVETLEAAALDAALDAALLEALPPWVIAETHVYWTMPEPPAELFDDTPAFVIDVGTAPYDAK